MFLRLWGQRFNFNCLRAIWPKGNHRESLEKSLQNGEYLNKQCEKVVFSQDSNLQPSDYQFTGRAIGPL